MLKRGDQTTESKLDVPINHLLDGAYAVVPDHYSPPATSLAPEPVSLALASAPAPAHA